VAEVESDGMGGGVVFDVARRWSTMVLLGKVKRKLCELKGSVEEDQKTYFTRPLLVPKLSLLLM
jgi:hypothetical protein